MLVEFLNGNEVQGGGIDAVALAGWGWPVVEDVAEVASIEAAMDLGARNAVACVGGGADIVIHQRFPETWPTGARIILVGAAEERDLCARKHVDSFALVVPVAVTEWRFGPGLAHNMVLFRSEQPAPLFLCAGDFEVAGDDRPGGQGTGAGFSGTTGVHG